MERRLGSSHHGLFLFWTRSSVTGRVHDHNPALYCSAQAFSKQAVDSLAPHQKWKRRNSCILGHSKGVCLVAWSIFRSYVGKLPLHMHVGKKNSNVSNCITWVILIQLCPLGTNIFPRICSLNSCYPHRHIYIYGSRRLYDLCLTNEF